MQGIEEQILSLAIQYAYHMMISTKTLHWWGSNSQPSDCETDVRPTVLQELWVLLGRKIYTYLNSIPLLSFGWTYTKTPAQGWHTKSWSVPHFLAAVLLWQWSWSSKWEYSSLPNFILCHFHQSYIVTSTMPKLFPTQSTSGLVYVAPIDTQLVCSRWLSWKSGTL